MATRNVFISSVLAFAAMAATVAHAQMLAPTPPMGWNSWDAYGLTIDEADLQGQCRRAGQ
jgi:alpha-galactosidase